MAEKIEIPGVAIPTLDCKAWQPDSAKDGGGGVREDPKTAPVRRPKLQE